MLVRAIDGLTTKIQCLKTGTFFDHLLLELFFVKLSHAAGIVLILIASIAQASNSPSNSGNRRASRNRYRLEPR